MGRIIFIVLDSQSDTQDFTLYRNFIFSKNRACSFSLFSLWVSSWKCYHLFVYATHIYRVPAVWTGTMLKARITNRKIEIDLVPALRSSHSWERGRQLTVTQCRDSSAKVPAKGETWSTEEEAMQPTWGELEEAQKLITSFQGRDSSL